MNNKIKCAVFDVDGTLYDEKSASVPASTILAIQKLKAKGILFVIASGRAPYGLGKALNELQADYILGDNGALVVNQKGEILKRHDFSRASVNQINAFAKRVDAGLCWKFTDKMYIYQNPEKIDWLASQLQSDIGYDPFVFDHLTRHLEDLPQSASLHAPVDLVNEEFKDNEELAFLAFSNDGYDVVLKGMNKGIGLLELMDVLNLKREEVIAVGDNYNDLEMLELAGVSVAMGNAIDEVKAKASFITKASSEDGIYFALKELGIIE